MKNRDGRPIKLEGNPEHPVSRGGLCTTGQASILGLYDNKRIKNPLRDGVETNWEEVDRQVTARLAQIREQAGAIRFLTGTFNSPTASAVLERFLGQFPNAKHVIYDPLSSSAILDAHEQTHGVRTLPRYHFDKADFIVSFDADFLGTWFSPVEHTQAHHEGRRLDGLSPQASRHIQFESRMSLTGTKADERIVVAPHELRPIVSQLATEVAALAGAPFDSRDSNAEPVQAERVRSMARDLWQARGRGLVISGTQEVAIQALCNFINHVLGNYGATIDLERPSWQRQGSDCALQELWAELEAGTVSALLICGVNPVYELPGGGAWRALLAKVPLVISFDERITETAEHAHFVCPDHHYLESWGDREPVQGVTSILQPCIHPLGNTRALIETLAGWSGDPRSAYELTQEHWRAHLFPRQTRGESFQSFWDRAVHDGVVEIEQPPQSASSSFELGEANTAQAMGAPGPEEYSLVLYPKAGMLDGRHAYNAWLQELPDPITKVTWDNYGCLSPAAARTLGVRDGDVIELQSMAGGATLLEVPVVTQPGQHDRVVAVALGYGSKATERFADVGPPWLQRRPTLNEGGRVGRNAAPLLRLEDGRLQYTGSLVRLRLTGRHEALACTQIHHMITVPEGLALPGGERRPVIQETTFEEYLQARASGDKVHAGPAHGSHVDLWPPDHPITGHRWGMAIDLDACTGCSACVISCQVENNIPVVGKDEVRRQREMHWMRIDRYYSGDGGEVEVAHQPMLCQHCENAPCETVCPVLATVHSAEGLNEQVYNRCVGTRYCANNCPYKVRRFNWFNYAHEDQLENMVLNPDVTVRSRGVMEKCSLCVQRIQESKIEAKRQGKDLVDGSIQTACQQSCPADAIIFGNLNDGLSRLSYLVNSSRHYHVLAELNVKPAVSYLGIVRRSPQPGREEEAGRG